MAMAETVVLLRLMTWLSPAFPVGAFSYSGGLAQVVADGDVGDADTLRDWLETSEFSLEPMLARTRPITETPTRIASAAATAFRRPVRA